MKLSDQYVEDSDVLAEIRRESQDLYNRIHSIAYDANFMEQVAETYNDLPCVPNLRCGAWYVDPKLASTQSAYFKSTDGHTRNWSFNLRRPNIHLLTFIEDHKGMLLVDSTRAGKRMPDALSKTVPIWCAVINRAVSLRYPDVARFHDPTIWNTKLYTPPGVVSAQEHTQISELLDSWAHDLATSSYEIPQLTASLRPVWVTPSTTSFPQAPSIKAKGSYPIVCVSASKQVFDGVERRYGGFSYVQGSGDDHELWGMGLTPEIFWKNQSAILRCSRAELQNTVLNLVNAVSGPLPVGTGTWKLLPSPVKHVRERILLCANQDLPCPLSCQVPIDIKNSGRVSYLQLTSAYDPVASDPTSSTNFNQDQTSNPPRKVINIPAGKRGNIHLLQIALPQAMSFVHAQLVNDRIVCISCDSGKDESVGIALTTLAMYFDENGDFRPEPGVQRLDKSIVKTRLQWIIASRPSANPSRATLKRVNEFLFTDPSLRFNKYATTPPLRSEAAEISY